MLRTRRLAGVAVAAVGLLYLMTLTPPGRSLSRLEDWIGGALAPIQRAASWTVERMRSGVEAVATYRSMREELAALRRDRSALEAIKARLSEAEAENRELRRALGFVERAPFDLLGGTVLARSPSAWFQTLVIDRGRRDGVAPGMAVLTDAGLIGRVVQVSERVSRVMLLTDQQSAAGALVQRSRDVGIVRGGVDGRLELEMFSPDADVQVGDRIVTSGLGLTFPKGLLIGTVGGRTAGPGSLTLTLEIVPAVDFDRLERVFLLRTVPQEDLEQLLGPDALAPGDLPEATPQAPSPR